MSEEIAMFDCKIDTIELLLDDEIRCAENRVKNCEEDLVLALDNLDKKRLQLEEFLRSRRAPKYVGVM